MISELISNSISSWSVKSAWTFYRKSSQKMTIRVAYAMRKKRNLLVQSHSIDDTVFRCYKVMLTIYNEFITPLALSSTIFNSGFQALQLSLSFSDVKWLHKIAMLILYDCISQKKKEENTLTSTRNVNKNWFFLIAKRNIFLIYLLVVIIFITIMPKWVTGTFSFGCYNNVYGFTFTILDMCSIFRKQIVQFFSYRANVNQLRELNVIIRLKIDRFYKMKKRKICKWNKSYGSRL